MFFYHVILNPMQRVIFTAFVGFFFHGFALLHVFDQLLLRVDKMGGVKYTDKLLLFRAHLFCFDLCLDLDLRVSSGFIYY